MLAYKHGATHKEIDAGKYPTNEQIVQALQLKVAKSVDIATRYRRVLWYSLFVTIYLVVLYLQASAYKSADVVSTLRNALMVDGQLSMTFNNEDEVLAYIGNKILLPTWKDPVCGDGTFLLGWHGLLLSSVCRGSRTHRGHDVLDTVPSLQRRCLCQYDGACSRMCRPFIGLEDFCGSHSTDPTSPSTLFQCT